MSSSTSTAIAGWAGTSCLASAAAEPANMRASNQYGTRLCSEEKATVLATTEADIAHGKAAHQVLERGGHAVVGFLGVGKGAGLYRSGGRHKGAWHAQLLVQSRVLLAKLACCKVEVQVRCGIQDVQP